MKGACEGWLSVGGPQGQPVHVEDGVEFLCGAGFGVEEALGAGAAEGDEGGGGDVGFHSFRDGAEAEGVREADDGPDDCQVVGVVPEVADEAPVDFEDVDGQRFELREGAVPGAEVVDRELNTEAAEPAQGGLGLRGVPDERFSVISRVRCRPSRPVSSRVRRTVSTKSVVISSAGDTFTLSPMGGRSGNWSCHVFICRQPVSRTHLPSSPARLVVSMRSMKLLGGSSPRLGCGQRTNASTPVMSPVVSATSGW